MAIDPHVHLRDWNESEKETLEHGLEVAWEAGLDGVFEMPNTRPALTSIINIRRRIDDADKAIENIRKRKPEIEIYHGLYAGITLSEKQIEKVMKEEEINDRVVGLKMFAGRSTGNMAIAAKDQQDLVYKTLADLDYRGILAVHCEKESLFEKIAFQPEYPYVHTKIRKPLAEIASVNDQISAAIRNGFKGKLHIVHASVPETIELVENYRLLNPGFKITIGVTPHHLVLDDTYASNILTKMNPPLRTEGMKDKMYKLLKERKIDWIETDHAPHTLKDKKENYASGIPGLPFYPEFIGMLSKDMTKEEIRKITHDNIEIAFGIKIEDTGRVPNSTYRILRQEYAYDAYAR